MALTAQVKDELARLPVDKTSCRKAEVAAMLRFAGGLHLVSGRIVIEAELDTAIAARRLRQAIAEVYGYTEQMAMLAPDRGCLAVPIRDGYSAIGAVTLSTSITRMSVAARHVNTLRDAAAALAGHVPALV